MRLNLRSAIVLVMCELLLMNPATGATVSPAAVTVASGSVCSGGSATVPVSATLPPAAVIDKVDVFMLFDDTGSFGGLVPQVTSIFGGLVSALETGLPGVSFGFGVGRFEDYGGPGSDFSGENLDGRPFVLNQPIVTAATAGSAAARDALIATALGRGALGFGGDTPETSVGEALYQVATGKGFDGDGNGSTLDSGVAGAVGTQTSPGSSGDVPAFASNTAPASGSLGGVGFRSGALHIVIIATDVCPVAPFPVGTIPRRSQEPGARASRPVLSYVPGAWGATVSGMFPMRSQGLPTRLRMRLHPRAPQPSRPPFRR